MWWLDPDDYDKDSPQNTWNKKFCMHEWKPVLLLISTVFDCAKCGMKKEDYESENKSKT